MVVDMTKSMVNIRNILFTFKEHNERNLTVIKQVYNARTLYHSSQRGCKMEMQHLMNLLERDMYIHWQNE